MSSLFPRLLYGMRSLWNFSHLVISPFSVYFQTNKNDKLKPWTNKNAFLLINCVFGCFEYAMHVWFLQLRLEYKFEPVWTRLPNDIVKFKMTHFILIKNLYTIWS